MPGSTPNRGYPFPIAGEPPAGHTQIQDLAMALDADAVAAAAPRGASGKIVPGPYNNLGKFAFTEQVNHGGLTLSGGNLYTVGAEGVWSISVQTRVLMAATGEAVALSIWIDGVVRMGGANITYDATAMAGYAFPCAVATLYLTVGQTIQINMNHWGADPITVVDDPVNYYAILAH